MTLAFLAILLLALPAGGGVGSWSTALAQAAIFATCFAWLAGEASRGRIRLAASPLHPAALLFFLFCLYQLSPLPGASLNRWATRVDLLNYLAWYLYFCLVASSVRNRRQVYLLAAAPLVTAALLSGWGLAQVATAGERVCRGPFVNRNHYAHWLSMATLLGFGFFCAVGPAEELPGAHRRRAAFFAFLRTPRFSVFLLAVFAATGLFFSLSRGGMLSFGGGFLVLAALLLLQRGFRRKSLLLPPLLLCLALLLAWLGAEPVLERLASIQDLALDSDSRMLVSRGTLAMFRAFPVTGSGLGTFAGVFPAFRPAVGLPWRVFFSHAHNEYLQLLAETGLVGFTLFAAGFGAFFIQGVRDLRRRRRPAAIALTAAALAALAAGLGHATVDFPFRIPANALLFALITALATVFSRGRFDEGGRLQLPARQVTVNRPGPVTAIAGAACLALIGLALLRPLAEHQAAGGNLAAAMRLEPDNGRWRYLAARGYLEDPDYQAQYALARPHLLAAVRLEPHNSRYRQTLGWFHANMGEWEAAETQLRRAVELAPGWPVRRQAYRHWFPDRPLPEPGE